MTNEKELLVRGHFQNIVDHSREVQGSALMPAEVPELRAGAARVEVSVVLGVGVSADVMDPDVIAFQERTCNFAGENQNTFADEFSQIVP